MDKDELTKDIDELWSHFFQVRATYPYARSNHVGQTFIESAPWYQQYGLHLRVEFGRPLAMDDVERLRELGYWVNQSFIIRLYALLEYHGIVSESTKIDTKLDGHEEVDILRRLRKYFVHTGRYNERDREQKKLFDRIVKHFELIGHDKDRFPLSIDTVVKVIFERTRIYVEGFEANIDTSRSKMNQAEIEKYLREHVPYSLRIMLGHINFMNRYYPNSVNDSQILQSVFVGSLTKGRMLLEAMGVKLNVAATDIQDSPSKNMRGKDVWADDLNGKLIDIQDLKTNRVVEYEYLKHYLIAANKYELHLTAQDVARDLEKYNKAIPVIVDMVDQSFYRTTPDNQTIRTELIETGALPPDYFK